MDSEFLWYRMRSSDGWVWINVEQVSEVQKFASNGWSVRLSSGNFYLISAKEAKRLCDKLGIKLVAVA